MQNKITISIPYTSQEEYEERQKDLIQEAIKEFLVHIESRLDEEKLLTRKQVSKKLHISLTTLNSLTKNGTLVGYRINGRVLYKEKEINNSLTRIESLKYKRTQ